ncbi:MAG: hypothetical protein K2I95_01055 [Treponemataceae bacterium]|nr:hypothetical protein [Treponemataceae bacterium]
MSEAWKRNLAVPFFTQRDNTFVWQAKGNAAGNKYNETCLAEFDVCDSEQGWIFED